MLSVSDKDVLAYVAGVTGHFGYTETFRDELMTPGMRIPITGDPDLWSRAVEVGRELLWAETFGGRFGMEGRSDVRFPPGDERRIQALTSITALPEGLTYDSARRLLKIGTGTFGPVDPRVWSYEVGGRNVLNGWFSYRKAEPGGKKTSPLDYLNADMWESSWTTELIEVLSALTRVVSLAEEQIAVLAEIAAGPTLSMEALAARGTVWPKIKKDRWPRLAGVFDLEGTLTQP
jgi:Type ISP C-terminal specificity domain